MSVWFQERKKKELEDEEEMERQTKEVSLVGEWGGGGEREGRGGIMIASPIRWVTSITNKRALPQ